MSHYVSKKRDARTTQRQYELMLDFMIKHPDIASGRHANTKRANYEKHWEELASVLNSDTAGPSKATTKWMKVNKIEILLFRKYFTMLIYYYSDSQTATTFVLPTCTDVNF